MREIVFDTETTGLSFAGGDRMVEIGCVELFNRVETGQTFHAYYHPERDMPEEAARVHGLRIDFLSKFPVFTAGVDALLDFIGDSPLIAHNAGFDFSFLNGELERCGRDPVCCTRMVDTLQIARSRHPGAKHTLDALCSRYGVDRSHRVLHGALLDAQLLAQVYGGTGGARSVCEWYKGAFVGSGRRLFVKGAVAPGWRGWRGRPGPVSSRRRQWISGPMVTRFRSATR
jgi:DNA polymerase-3 subunit epsilon